MLGAETDTPNEFNSRMQTHFNSRQGTQEGRLSEYQSNQRKTHINYNRVDPEHPHLAPIHIKRNMDHEDDCDHVGICIRGLEMESLEK